MTVVDAPFTFTLSESQIATAPAEERGSGRDDVRMMVAHRSSGIIVDDHFPNLGSYLRPGDALVVNTSATIPAAVDVIAEDGTPLKAHFAGPAAGGLWQVEVRAIRPSGGTEPGPDLAPQTLRMPGVATLQLLARSPRTPRLWVAAFDGAEELLDYLARYGHPVRYGAGADWPLEAHQTVFATHPGSAEMPSAARAFTVEMVTSLVSSGIAVVPVLLHAGVSSYETGEAPGEERFAVSPPSAALMNSVRSSGGRLIAVGTTVVRALETVADDLGLLHPGRGITDIVITPARPPRAVDGLLTGWHEPRSSHLELLESLLPRPQLRDVYDEAVAHHYLWHEFGDLLLVLP
jgi:S-adenosylmethionine:tRNA ribosyltransferase-isomerase